MKKKKVKKEKTPMTPEIKKTWMTSLTAFICVIAVSATANSVIGKVCDAKVEAAVTPSRLTRVRELHRRMFRQTHRMTVTRLRLLLRRTTAEEPSAQIRRARQAIKPRTKPRQRQKPLPKR